MSKKRSQESSIDYYELLQVNQNADLATIERVYRFLAKRYHPDNVDTGDAAKFQMLLILQRHLGYFSDCTETHNLL